MINLRPIFILKEPITLSILFYSFTTLYYTLMYLKQTSYVHILYFLSIRVMRGHLVLVCSIECYTYYLSISGMV